MRQWLLSKELPVLLTQKLVSKAGNLTSLLTLNKESIRELAFSIRIGDYSTKYSLFEKLERAIRYEVKNRRADRDLQIIHSWIPPQCPPSLLEHARPMRVLMIGYPATWGSAVRTYVRAFEPDSRLLAELATTGDENWKFFLPAGHPRGETYRRLSVFGLYDSWNTKLFHFQVILILILTSKKKTKKNIRQPQL